MCVRARPPLAVRTRYLRAYTGPLDPLRCPSPHPHDPPPHTHTRHTTPHLTSAHPHVLYRCTAAFCTSTSTSTTVRAWGAGGSGSVGGGAWLVEWWTGCGAQRGWLPALPCPRYARWCPPFPPRPIPPHPTPPPWRWRRRRRGGGVLHHRPRDDRLVPPAPGVGRPALLPGHWSADRCGGVPGGCVGVGMRVWLGGGREGGDWQDSVPGVAPLNCRARCVCIAPALLIIACLPALLPPRLRRARATRSTCR